MFHLAAVLLLVGPPLLAACVSTPARPQVSGVVFPQPLDRARQEVVNTLAVLGFDVKKQEPTYLEGFRPRKVGLLVGSGGETVGVWLEPAGDRRTRVRVDTAKSLAGFVGQKNWDKEVLAELEKALGKSE
jgi:hypothetical protein